MVDWQRRPECLCRSAQSGNVTAEIISTAPRAVAPAASQAQHAGVTSYVILATVCDVD